MSGHRRRKCGKEVGLTEFPCYVREKTDDEAILYLVDANLAYRKTIKPTERAKAYLMRKQVLRDERLKEKADEDISMSNEERLTTKEKLMKENNMSNGNIQRYLRINFLNDALQKAVDDGKINLKVAEQLSFLKEEEQNIIGNFIKKDNRKITELQAKKLKQTSAKEKLTQEKIETLIDNKNISNKITITFDESELNVFYEDLKDKAIIKKEILKALEQQRLKNTPGVLLG